MTTTTLPGAHDLRDAVLSLDDVKAEATLLKAHDLTSLHTRLAGAIRRRQIAMTLLAGAAALAAAGGVAHLASRATLPPPPPPLEAPALAVAPVLHLDVAPAAPCTTGAGTTTSTTSAAAAPVTRVVVVQRDPVDDGERVLVEGSRLRAQLRIYDEGQRALVGGDPTRALARATHLREKYPNGPLDIDAAILAVRALRALERDDDARAALTDAERHPLAAEKGTVLAELRMLLTRVEPPAKSRVLSSLPDVQEPPAPVEHERATTTTTAPEEERRPSRVIGVVSP